MTTAIRSEATRSVVVVNGVDVLGVNQDGSMALLAPVAAPAGNQIPTAGQTIGFGQTWQDVTLTRALNTNYTNTTGRPITIVVSLLGAINTAASLQLLIGGVSVISTGSGALTGSQSRPAGTLVIPNGAVYRAQNGSGSETLFIWSELR